MQRDAQTAFGYFRIPFLHLFLTYSSDRTGSAGPGAYETLVVSTEAMFEKALLRPVAR